MFVFVKPHEVWRWFGSRLTRAVKGYQSAGGRWFAYHSHIDLSSRLRHFYCVVLAGSFERILFMSSSILLDDGEGTSTQQLNQQTSTSGMSQAKVLATICFAGAQRTRRDIPRVDYSFKRLLSDSATAIWKRNSRQRKASDIPSGFLFCFSHLQNLCKYVVCLSCQKKILCLSVFFNYQFFLQLSLQILRRQFGKEIHDNERPQE